MLFEHWIYSTAIAIIVGMVYYKFTGRDYSWIIIASAYAPDIDMIADAVLKKIGITVMIYGNPISHGDFHNIAVLVHKLCETKLGDLLAEKSELKEEDIDDLDHLVKEGLFRRVKRIE